MTKSAATLSRRAILLTLGAAATAPLIPSAFAAEPAIIPMARKEAFAYVRGIRVPYISEAQETVLRNSAGEARASIFGASYIAKNQKAADRPVTFFFNGGPGGASWPLHSTLSPRKFAKADNDRGFAIVNNEDSPIDCSDLVFIDAPGTGYSRFFTDDAKPEYWGVEQDASGVAAYIEDWLKRHKRQKSPVYIAGESYGGTRTAQLLRILGLRENPVNIAGCILISPTVDPTGSAQIDGIDMQVISLPTLAAVARWYGRGAYTQHSVADVADMATEYANTQYAAAMASLDTLSNAEKQALAARLSDFIGLSPELIVRQGYRISTQDFSNSLLASDGLLTKMSDGRGSYPAPKEGDDSSLMSQADGYDLHEAILSLLNEELGYSSTNIYQRNPLEASQNWNHEITQTPARMDRVVEAMAAKRPDFRMLLLAGRFDLIIPYRLPMTVLEQANLPDGAYNYALYSAGHAIPDDEIARAVATDDMRAFYRGQKVSRS